MDNIITVAMILMPMVLAITEIVKSSVVMKKNLIPLVSVIIGLILGVLSYYVTDLHLEGYTVVDHVFIGFASGVLATGTYELGKFRGGNTGKSDTNKL